MQQGNIHNIYAIMAESPLLLKGHTALRDLFEATGLSSQERRIVLLAASRENGSAYSVALQSDAAEKNEVPVEVIEAIRASKPLKDKKLEKLRAFTAKVVNSRAQIAERDVKGIPGRGLYACQYPRSDTGCRHGDPDQLHQPHRQDPARQEPRTQAMEEGQLRLSCKSN